jgi:UDP-N-acetyl-D-galactosamine dehydrogenase
VPDILAELKTFGIEAIAHDPLAAPKEVARDYRFQMSKLSRFRALDALILAVPHASYLAKPKKLMAMLRDGGILVDIKSAIDPRAVPGNLRYWSL